MATIEALAEISEILRCCIRRHCVEPFVERLLEADTGSVDDVEDDV